MRYYRLPGVLSHGLNGWAVLFFQYVNDLLADVLPSKTVSAMQNAIRLDGVAVSDSELEIDGCWAGWPNRWPRKTPYALFSPLSSSSSSSLVMMTA